MDQAETRALHPWAHQTFGHAELGHRSRVRRLVSMAARLAASPAGTVTSVFGAADEREGAFRLLSNPNVASASVTQAVSRSTFEACRRWRAYCALAGTSISLM